MIHLLGLSSYPVHENNGTPKVLLRGNNDFNCFIQYSRSVLYALKYDSFFRADVILRIVIHSVEVPLVFPYKISAIKINIE